jgi:hypothetical protein
MARAESQELILQSLHELPSSAIAFTVDQPSRKSFSSGRSPFKTNRGGSLGGRGRDRRSAHCQLCRVNGYYVNQYPSLSQYASKTGTSVDNFSGAFHAQCSVTSPTPDWFVDIKGNCPHDTFSGNRYQWYTVK